MRNIFKTTSIFCALVLLLCVSPKAQLLKKIKDKANQAVDKAFDKKVNETTQPNGDNSNGGNGKVSNKGGAGLKNSSPPDVMAQIADAEKAHNAGNFNDARYSVQQALMGVEIQLGREILKSLPSTVNGMDKDTAANIVMSNNWGWNNLTIQTVYNQKPEKQMTITIGNNSMYSGLANVYFGNTAYVQANDKDQNVKQTKVKGYKAVIQYSDNKGYTLLVSLGQTALIVWECVNFKDEDDVMKTASEFDIDGIKKMMGEQ